MGKAEQLNVQRSLGLGTELLDPQTVIAAWQQGRSVEELEAVLRRDGQRLSDGELLA